MEEPSTQTGRAPEGPASSQPLASARPPASPPTMFGILADRNFRLYWIALQLSVLARIVQFVAQNWLVLELTNSPLMLGVTSLANTLPSLALTLVGGAIADRANRKIIFIATELIMAFLYIVLATLIATGTVRIEHVIIFAFLTGCVRALDQPTRQAILPQVISKKDMINAVVLVNIVWQLGYLAGPAVAGMLIYLWGVGSAFYVGAVGFLVTVALLLLVHVEPAQSTGKKRSLLQEMAEGLDYIRNDAIVRTLIGLSVFNGIFGLSYQTLMPVFARDILDVGSRGYGFLNAASGAGSVIGAFIVAYLARFRKKGWQILIGAAVSGLLLIGFALSSSYPLSMGILFLIGVATDLYLTTTGSVLQLYLPDQLRGRVFAIYGLTWGLMPLGGMILGTTAEFAGAPIAVVLAGVLVTATAVYIAMTKPKMRRLE